MKTAIIGLGQIGGSIALKLRERGEDPDLFDIDERICQTINGRCERFSGRGYDLVILALHTDILIETMKILPKDNLYMDTASIKKPVIEAAKENGLEFVGGHPIAGNEKKGMNSWDPKLFEGRPFALVDTGIGSSKKETVERFVGLLEAIPEWIGAEFHDLALAHTSHAMYFLSRVVKNIGEPYEMLSGPGYDSMTRLSKQDPALGKAFERYNARNVADVLDEVSERLKEVAREMRK